MTTSHMRPVFSAGRVQHISDLHSKFAHIMTVCGSMVDIQSATAENKPGEKEETKLQNIMICPIGRP